MTLERAYLYAKGYGPSEETRKIACKDPYDAYYYARDVDKCPRKDTRKGACKDPEYAYAYAKNVDKGFHEVTWNTVKNTEYEQKYIEFLNSLNKEEII